MSAIVSDENPVQDQPESSNRTFASDLDGLKM